jgi:hypothetical protein
MKKARLILTTIVLLSIAGGAWAIKISKFGQGSVWFWDGSYLNRIDYKTTIPPFGFHTIVYTTTNPPISIFTYITTVPIGM